MSRERELALCQRTYHAIKSGTDVVSAIRITAHSRQTMLDLLKVRMSELEGASND